MAHHASHLSASLGFSGNSGGQESTCNTRDPGSIPGLGRSPGEAIVYPLQCGLPWWLRCKEFTCSVGDLGPIPGLGRYPVGGHSNPLQYSGLDTPHGQRSLVGYSPWGHKVLDMTEQLSTLCSLTRLIFF